MLSRHDTTRATLYRQLAACQKAGLPLASAIADAAARPGPVGALLRPVAARLDAGDDLPGAFAAGDFGPLERAVVRAAARAGTLVEGFEQLADLFAARRALKHKLTASLCYPLGLLHAAVFLPSLPVLIKDGVAGYAAATVLPLLGLYGAVLGLVVGGRALRRANPLLVDRCIAAVPGVGGLTRQRALALGLRAFGALYRSGIPAFEALAGAAEVCPHAPLAASFAAVERRAREGADLPEAFAAEAHAFPPHVLDAIATGAKTGQLDEQVARAVERLDQDAGQTQTVLLVVVGVGAFLAVAGLVAYRVISFYADLYGQIGAF